MFFNRKPKEEELLQELIRLLNKCIREENSIPTATNLLTAKSLIIGYAGGRGYFLDERIGLKTANERLIEAIGKEVHNGNK